MSQPDILLIRQSTSCVATWLLLRVASPADLIEYRVEDSSTVEPNAKKGYSERFIHGEMFKKFPGVNCVIHSHAEDVLPYAICGVPFKAVYHMAGFLGTIACIPAGCTMYG